jgi:hypothetical protein
VIEQRVIAAAAAVVLLALPIADFARDGNVADTFVAALLALALGGGLATERVLRQRLAQWAKPRDERGNGSHHQ